MVFNDNELEKIFFSETIYSNKKKHIFTIIILSYYKQLFFYFCHYLYVLESLIKGPKIVFYCKMHRPRIYGSLLNVVNVVKSDPPHFCLLNVSPSYHSPSHNKRNTHLLSNVVSLQRKAKQ